MATADNERYLRHVWLLGEGGLFVLRGIVTREAAKIGQPLEQILSNSRTKFQNILKEQKLKLFHSPSTANDDIETWDMSLLIVVVKRLFWASLSPVEQSCIDTLKNHRNTIQAHPTTLSMVATDYNTSRQLVDVALRQLASGISQHAAITIDDIIKNTGTGILDIQLALQHIKDTHEFKTSLLSALENIFNNLSLEMSNVSSKISSIEGSIHNVEESNKTRHGEVTTSLDGLHMAAKSTQQDIAEVKGSIHNVEESNETRHGEVTTSLDGLHIAAKSTQQDIAEVKGSIHNVEESNETRHGEVTTSLDGLHIAAKSTQQDIAEVKANDELTLEKLGSIEKLIEKLVNQQTEKSQVQQEVDTNINLNSERPENAAEAQGIIVTRFNDILKKIRPDMIEDSANADAFNEKVHDLLRREEGNEYELTSALLQLINDILPHGHIQQASKGSIKLTIRFTTYSGILQFMQYLNTTKFQNCLKDISRALEYRTGHAVTLSANIAQESLFDLHKHLGKCFKVDADECEKLRRTRKVVLPVRCKGITDLRHIWELLQRGGADRHMKRISEILTKLVGGNVTVTTSVNLKQFEQALIEIAKPVELQMSEQAELGFAAAKRDLDKNNASLRVNWDTDILRSLLGEEETKKNTDESDSDNESRLVNTDTDPLKSLPDEKAKKSTEEFDFEVCPEMDGTTLAQNDGKGMSPESSHSEMKKAEDIDEQDNTTPSRPTKKYSARYKIDTEIPYICGIKSIPNKGILINDWSNKTLKMLDCSLDIVSDHYNLPEYSWDVCYIENGSAVVCLERNSILFIDVSDFTKRGREVKFEHSCCGLAYYKNTLYIVDGTSRVHAYEGTKGLSYEGTSGLIRNSDFTTKPVESKTILNRHIAVSDDGKMIYITSGDDGLETIDNKGNRMSLLKSETLSVPVDVCVFGDGTILVCELHSNAVLQVDYGGKRVLKTIATVTSGFQPYAMCFDRQNSRLLVGGDNAEVHAIELQDM